MRALLIASLLAAASCGGDDGACGPGAALGDGLLASADMVEMNFGGLAGGLNNDCPDPNAPAGVESLTIEGTQADGSGRITFCVARPDLLTTTSQALGPDAPGSPVRLIDLTGTSNNCTFTTDTTRLPTGIVSATGVCDDGSNAAGFALVVHGAVPLARTCAGVTDQVDVTLVGTVAVKHE